MGSELFLCFDDFALLVGGAVELVDEIINLGVGGDEGMGRGPAGRCRAEAKTRARVRQKVRL